MNRRASTMNLALMTVAIAAAGFGAGQILDIRNPSQSGRGGGTPGISMGPRNYKACGKRKAMNKIARRSRKINGAKR